LISLEDKETELHVLATLPIIMKWIETDKELTVEDFNILKRMYPEQYRYGSNSTVKGLIEMNSRYRESKLYKKFIDILLSEQGVRWLANNHSRLLAHNQNHPEKT